MKMNPSRKIDDACGATALHLVNGIWGQLSVGFFADPPTGPKGLFLGGGPNQLIVQAISCISITIWSMVAMVILLWFVNSIIPIRLSPEDEALGCDITEHYQGKYYNLEIVKPSTKLEKIIEITTPIAKRFTESVEHRNRRNSDGFYGRPKLFYVNEGYEIGGERY
jgi:hypothetical protein